MKAPWRFAPSTTTKWLKFQNTIAGRGTVVSSAVSIRIPLLSRPRERAAFSTLDAREPSLVTPQVTRSSSKETQRP